MLIYMHKHIHQNQITVQTRYTCIDQHVSSYMKDKKHGLNHSIRKLSRLYTIAKKKESERRSKEKLVILSQHTDMHLQVGRLTGRGKIDIVFNLDSFLFFISMWNEEKGLKKEKTLLLLLIYIPIIMLFLTLD